MGAEANLASRGSFLGVLSAEELRDLRGRAVTRHFAAGATLLHQGEPPGRVLVVESGCVKVSATTEDGREAILSFRGPGDLLGEFAAVDGAPRSASVFAVEPVTALALSSSDFARFVEANPRAPQLVTCLVVERLRDADRERIELGTQKTLARVAGRLVELADRYGSADGDAILIGLPLSQEELASWAAASREATSKALHTLRSVNLVETRRRRFTVLDLESLRRFCASGSTGRAPAGASRVELGQ